MAAFPPTSGWFATTIPTYTTASANTAQPIYYPPLPQPQPLPLTLRASKPEPLEWLRSRVGEYVEAGALAA